MILIPKDKQNQLNETLIQHGFNQQHSRIFNQMMTDGDAHYHCTIGLEDADEQTFEVNISVIRRPVATGRHSMRVEDIQVVPLDQAPQSLQDTLADLEEQLEQLA